MEIAINVRKKYNKISELLDLTKQMADSLQRNDMISFEVLLNMRTDVILDIEDISNKTQSILQALEPNLAEKIRLLLYKKDLSHENLTSTEQKIRDIVSESARLTQRLVLQDEIINKKISGKDSFYQK